MTEKSSDALPGDAELDPVLVAVGERLLIARMHYGSRLKPARIVSQGHVGRIFDVTGVTVGAWEAGRNDAGVPMLYKLADYYGVNRVWLLTGIGEMRDEGGGNVPRANGPTPRPRPAITTPPDPNVYASTVKRKPVRRRRRQKPPGDRDKTARAG